jgi:hypothetical protein
MRSGIGQEFGRSHLDLTGHDRGQRDRLEFPVAAVGDADHREPSTSHYYRRRMLEFPKTEEVGKRSGGFFSNEQTDFNLVLKSERVEVITFGMDAREPEWRVELGHDDRAAEGAKKRVLGGFHVAKEIGEMNNAGHVGIGELDATDGGELAGHSGRL